MPVISEGRSLGLRVKLGWALGIVVAADDGGAPTVVAREELRFAPEEGAYAYHAAMDAQPEDRDRVVADAARLAEDAATTMLAAVAGHHGASAVGLVVGRGVRKIPIERILASSRLFHTADAEVLQDAFTEAAARLRLPCLRVPFAGAEEDPSWERISRLGRSAGPPWRKDHKLAATAGWMALQSAAAR